MADLRRQNAIRELTEPTVERLGFELIAVELLTDRGSVLLRLSVDRKGGVSAGDCARVSFELSPLLDQDDPIIGGYRLEVSSPGIERPLQRAVDFQRFKGYRARLRLAEGFPRRRYSGTLGGLDGEQVLIEAENVEHRVPLEAITRAHLMLDIEEYQALAEGLHEQPASTEEGPDDQ